MKKGKGLLLPLFLGLTIHVHQLNYFITAPKRNYFSFGITNLLIDKTGYRSQKSRSLLNYGERLFNLPFINNYTN
ncbi:hypothetical protein COM13_22715 [Bacillus pseudomycoides]|nr:hypothetical protein CON58_26435 [Bacillus pseudomycoides]PEF21161.1 hypothetical protein CON69_29500 [Bacillus pseudomycoides]PEJ20120.1 hypothetical protein CN887_27875 [Bacillus pseudomycoides]PEK29456.1 hypothetical protein CN691_21635 [Bacillus pseudomycoides]PEK62321.1 hypothetical protein CN593_25625 [Bacillus pseudomycoides]